MIHLEYIVWICLALVGYAYVGYPLLVAIAARLRRSRPAPADPPPRAVSIILAVHNEAGAIGRRIRELASLLRGSGLDGELIVVSDGSTDGTASIARSLLDPAVRVLELRGNFGKAVALTRAYSAARFPFLVFADARQRWDTHALRRLVDRFADPAVGAVSGDLVLESEPGVMAGVGLYWRYEKWLRRNESRLHSTVGVTGAICAVRRDLFRPIPPGTLLDDVYWPLCVAMQGFRVVHEEGALARDTLPENPRDEFRRKVRTLSGNFQLLTRLPSSLLPWRNPVWIQFVSHKLARLLVPWALLAMLALTAILPPPLYRTAFMVQGALYAIALLGMIPAVGRRFRLAAAASSFLVLNAAAFVAFWTWITGNAGRSWKKVEYRLPPAHQPVSSS